MRLLCVMFLVAFAVPGTATAAVSITADSPAARSGPVIRAVVHGAAHRGEDALDAAKRALDQMTSQIDRIHALVHRDDLTAEQKVMRINAVVHE